MTLMLMEMEKLNRMELTNYNGPGKIIQSHRTKPFWHMTDLLPIRISMLMPMGKYSQVMHP